MPEVSTSDPRSYNIVIDNPFKPSNGSNVNDCLESFRNSLSKAALLLISKWYNDSTIPRNKVQGMIEDINEFLNEGSFFINS